MERSTNEADHRSSVYFSKMAQLISEKNIEIDLPLSMSKFQHYIPPENWRVDNDGVLLHNGYFEYDKNTTFTIFGPLATAFVSDSVNLRNCRIIARGRHNVVFIGEGCRLKNVTIECKGKYCTVMIGAGSSWEDGACIVGGDNMSVLIGNDCQFAAQVVLRTDDGHGIFDRDSKSLINPPASVAVGAHVWIGRGSTISKGTTIGSGSVLAAGSLAKNTLEARAIYAGSPAVVKKRNITWSRTYAWDDIPEIYR